MVVLTSNNTRELSEALKRRCLFLYIDYPTLEAELEIVRIKVPELDEQIAAQALEVVHQLRKLDLRKNPGISESLDWARALLHLNARKIDREVLEATLTVLLKHERDVQLAQLALQREESRPQPTTGYPPDEDDLRSRYRKYS